MSSAYTNVTFTQQQPDQQTAMKLNLLIGDLSAALDSIGGYYSNAWRWTTSTADATSKNAVGINAATWAAATLVNVNETAADGRDMTKGFSELFVAGNDLYLQDQTNSANNAIYTISAAGTDHGTWWSFPVTYKSGSGIPPGNNVTTDLTIYVKGAAGGGGTGTGDMTKAIYDTDNNGKVDTADAIGWTAVTGKPSAFPPDSTAMLKSVYDTNADNIVDHAALADTAPWTGISGIPASFVPSAHAATHLDNGADPIPVVTTFRTGLVPTLNGNASTYLNGSGAYSAPSGAGDMLKSVYDINADNIVDKAAALSTAGAVHQFWKNGNAWGQPDWSDLTNVPAIFPATSYYGTDTTNSAAYAVSVASNFVLAAGVVVFVTPSVTCATSPTLNVNSTGAKAIVNRANIALSASEIVSNRMFGVVYDGTSWRVITNLCRYYSAANPVNPTIECAGYDSVSVYGSYSSNTGAAITLAHVGQGVWVTVDIVNATASAFSYSINATDPGGTTLQVYWAFSNALTGIAITRIDSTNPQSLNANMHFNVSGSYRTGATVILK